MNVDNHLLQMNGCLQREKDGEPGKHSGGMSSGIDRQHYVLVENSFEVAGKAVQHGIALDGETQCLRATVIHRGFYHSIKKLINFSTFQ